MEKDDQFQEVSLRGKVLFCRCILGWKVGSCAKCESETPKREELHKKIIGSLIQAQEMRMAMEDRRKTLGKGLAKLLDQSDYDAKANTRKIKPDERLGLGMLVKFLRHKINQKIRTPDPEFRKRSPLVNSKIRAKSMTKVHVLGKSITNPSVLIVAPTERFHETTRRVTTRLSSAAQYSPAEVSPLLPSHQRKSVVSMSDNIETLRERAITRIGPLAKRSTLLPFSVQGLDSRGGGTKNESSKPNQEIQ